MKKIGKIFVAIFLILYLLVNEVFASAIDHEESFSDFLPAIAIVIVIFGISISFILAIIADLFNFKKLKTISINVISFLVLVSSIIAIIVQFWNYNDSLNELNSFFGTYNLILVKIVGFILIANTIFLYFKKHNTLKDIAITYFCFSFIIFLIAYIIYVEAMLIGNIYIELGTTIVLLVFSALLYKKMINK